MNNIDWNSLSFSYTRTRTIVYSRCIDGKWESPVVTEDFNFVLSPFAGVFHYAPSCFEGLKAYRGVDGKIRLFRPDMNAKRMKDGAMYLDMPYPSEELFIDMCVRCVKGNLEFLPPVEVPSASLYLRPVLFGYNPQLGIRSARDVMFAVMCSPVGTYSGAKSLAPANAVISRNYDRSAAQGSGGYKLGANYAHITNGTIDNAKIGYADVNDLSAHYADVGLANVDNAWIERGVLRDASVSDAKIIGVSANKLTAGTIDASRINVTNLNANNITVGTINGQRIGEGSLSLDKLSESVAVFHLESSVSNRLSVAMSPSAAMILESAAVTAES